VLKKNLTISSTDKKEALMIFYEDDRDNFTYKTTTYNDGTKFYSNFSDRSGNPISMKDAVVGYGNLKRERGVESGKKIGQEEGKKIGKRQLWEQQEYIQLIL
jgi:hypothetical protein